MRAYTNWWPVVQAGTTARPLGMTGCAAAVDTRRGHHRAQRGGAPGRLTCAAGGPAAASPCASAPGQVSTAGWRLLPTCSYERWIDAKMDVPSCTLPRPPPAPLYPYPPTALCYFELKIIMEATA